MLSEKSEKSEKQEAPVNKDTKDSVKAKKVSNTAAAVVKNAATDVKEGYEVTDTKPASKKQHAKLTDNFICNTSVGQGILTAFMIVVLSLITEPVGDFFVSNLRRNVFMVEILVIIAFTMLFLVSAIGPAIHAFTKRGWKTALATLALSALFIFVFLTLIVVFPLDISALFYLIFGPEIINLSIF